MIAAADSSKSSPLGFLLTFFLRSSGGKQGALSPFRSQEHQGAEMFLMFSGVIKGDTRARGGTPGQLDRPMEGY